MEEREYCVYKHECPNGKVYIGITCQKLNLRWNGGHGYDTQFFGKAVRKYGWANIKHEILFSGLSLEEAYQKEKECIEKYNSMNPERGYNCDAGGAGAEGHTVSQEVREKQSKLAKAMWNDPEKRKTLENHLSELSIKNIGRKRSEEATRKTIAKTSKKIDQYTTDGDYIATYSSMMEAARSVGKESNSEIVSCCKWKRLYAHGFIWRYFGEPVDIERVEKLKELHKKKVIEHNRKSADANCKSVVQLDSDGSFLKIFKSIVEASKETGIGKTNIGSVCKHRTHLAGGYKWQYANEYNNSSETV